MGPERSDIIYFFKLTKCRLRSKVFRGPAKSLIYLYLFETGLSRYICRRPKPIYLFTSVYLFISVWRSGTYLFISVSRLGVLSFKVVDGTHKPVTGISVSNRYKPINLFKPISYISYRCSTRSNRYPVYLYLFKPVTGMEHYATLEVLREPGDPTTPWRVSSGCQTRPPRWGSTFGVLRVPDEMTTPGPPPTN